MSIDTVFLDLDGCCVNLHGRLAEVFGFDLDAWPKGEYSFTKALGRPLDDIWGDPRVQGAAFWATLDPLPWFADLVKLAFKHAEDVVFLSGTVRDPGSAAGKQAWIQRHAPDAHFLLGPSRTKARVARRGAVLIDDADRNVTEWRDAGGERGILFPRRWNSAHADEPRALQAVEDELDAAACS